MKLRNWLAPAALLGLLLSPGCGCGCDGYYAAEVIAYMRPKATDRWDSSTVYYTKDSKPYVRWSHAMNPNGTLVFEALDGKGKALASPVTWSTERGTINANGAYTAPATLGPDSVVATFTDGSGQKLRQTLEVIASPEIKAFSVDKTSVAKGESVILSWEYPEQLIKEIQEDSWGWNRDWRTEGRIETLVGSTWNYISPTTSSKSSMVVTVQQTTTFRLKITSPGGESITRELTITVRA